MSSTETWIIRAMALLGGLKEQIEVMDYFQESSLRGVKDGDISTSRAFGREQNSRGKGRALRNKHLMIYMMFVKSWIRVAGSEESASFESLQRRQSSQGKCPGWRGDTGRVESLTPVCERERK